MFKNEDLTMLCKEDIYFTTEEGIEIAFKKGEQYEVWFDNEGQDYLISNGYKCAFHYCGSEFREYFEIVFIN